VGFGADRCLRAGLVGYIMTPIQKSLATAFREN